MTLIGGDRESAGADTESGGERGLIRLVELSARCPWPWPPPAESPTACKGCELDVERGGERCKSKFWYLDTATAAAAAFREAKIWEATAAAAATWWGWPAAAAWAKA